MYQDTDKMRMGQSHQGGFERMSTSTDSVCSNESHPPNNSITASRTDNHLSLLHRIYFLHSVPTK